MDVRYEDVVQNPEKTWRSITEFLGLSQPIQWKNTNKETATIRVDDVWYTSDQRQQPIGAQNIGKWKTSFSALDRAYLNALMAHHLDLLGYDVPAWALWLHRTFRKKDR